jgi:CHAT domain-containing protein/tetratricopeptide (TPR) repeat protein
MSADAVLDQARAALRGGGAAEREAAAAVLERAIGDAAAAGDAATEAEALRLRGELLILLGRDAAIALSHLQRAASLFDALGRLSDEARATSQAGIALRRLGRAAEAEQAQRTALGLYERAGDRSGQAAVLHNLGAALFGQGRLDAALAHYERSIAIRRELGEHALTASSLNNSATIYGQQGRPDLAVDTHRRALAVGRESGSRNDQAYALLGLGSQSYRLGDLQPAIGYLTEAASLFEALGDRSGLGFARHTLGVIYLSLGHDADAITVLEQVLPLRKDDPARLGTTLQSLGGAYSLRGEIDRARQTLEQALALKRQAKDRFGEAATLRSLAGVELEAGRVAPAREHARAALDLSREVDAAVGVPLSLVLLSRAGGDHAASHVEELGRAVDSARAVRSPQVEAAVRAELARVALRTGDLALARAHAAAAVEAVERVRSAVASLDLRATYFASQADLLDLQVEILLASHRAAPAAGHDRAAFEAAERARGRRLIDALGDAMTPRADESPARARERVLERDVSVAAIALERRDGQSPGDLTRLQADLDARLLALRTFRAETRAQLPWRRESPPLDLAALQRQLPEDTTLISYWLGRARSAAWVVGPSRVTLVDLAPGERVRPAIADAHTALSTSSAHADVALRALADLVWRPVEAHLGSRRVAIVASGPLELVPFAALPTREDGPLVARHVLLRLPTAAWPAASEGPRQWHPGGPRIAVLADPVFATDDVRVAAVAGGPRDDAPVAREGDSFARLRFSRMEADAVAALAPGAVLLTDADASKDRFLSLPLADLDVLHLATHATQHADRPELSAIVLSLVDRGRTPVDGRVRLHEVVGLPLDGQTVVLSACRTIIGPDLRGDGLQGLGRAFLHAGAGTVVASLWEVDDRATMVLMRHFYEALAGRRLTADRALAIAQRRLQRDQRWRHPRYWAGFVALGAPR